MYSSLKAWIRQAQGDTFYTVTEIRSFLNFSTTLLLFGGGMSEDILKRNGENSKFSKSMDWMEAINQPRMETLVLKSGERVQGVIVMEDKGYLVYATNGIRIFRLEEVLGKEI
jgi:hypothetical protein